MSLGCPRNLVDSELLLGAFKAKGFDLVDAPEKADAVIVNTCGFIEDAKEESIRAILQLAEFKKEGRIKKLIVTGCLSQRYHSELMKDIAEIDGIFGTGDFIKIPDAIDTIFSGEKVQKVTPRPSFLYDHTVKRELLTQPHYAYIKIQEGCSNECSYCVIPSLKGARRSRTAGSVVKEIEKLRSEQKIKEFILIGQDTTSFGLDRAGKPELAGLLDRVSSAAPDSWIRLLYTHPVHFTDELIEVIASKDNICKYVDLPIQHVNDRILRRMNRRVTKNDMSGLIGKIRRMIKDVTVRTSVIVGFPGETESEFKELSDFLADIRFDRLGAFIYSREEGTPAAGFKTQVPDEVKKARFNEVMQLQQGISRENNQELIDTDIKVLIDEAVRSGTGQFIGRGQMDAPEVDGVVYVTGSGIKIGEFTDVHVTGTMEYDLIGEAV